MDMVYYIKKSLLLSLTLGTPTVVVAVVVGFLISFLQAIMQLQDQSLPFGTKLVGVVVVLLLTGTWMSGTLIQFTDQLFSQIQYHGRH